MMLREELHRAATAAPAPPSPQVILQLARRRQVVRKGLLSAAGAVGVGSLVVAAFAVRPPWSHHGRTPSTVAMSAPASSAWPGPSGAQAGPIIHTHLIIDRSELVLTLRTPPAPAAAWLDLSSTRLSVQTRPATEFVATGAGPDRISGVTEIDAGRGRIIEYGAVYGSTDRVVVHQSGRSWQADVAAPIGHTAWRDGPVTLFWLLRPGTLATTGTPAGALPTVVSYRPDGGVLDSEVFRPGDIAAAPTGSSPAGTGAPPAPGGPGVAVPVPMPPGAVLPPTHFGPPTAPPPHDTPPHDTPPPPHQTPPSWPVGPPNPNPPTHPTPGVPPTRRPGPP